MLYIFFLGNFDVLRMSGLEGAGSTNVLWSVSVEEQFYLLWPLLFRFVPPRWFAAIFPTIIAGSFTFRALHANEGPTLYFHSFSVVSDMAIGGLAAYVWRQRPEFRTLVATVPRFAIVTGYLLGGLFVCTQALWGPYGGLVAGTIFACVVLEQNFCRNSFLKMSRSKLLSELGRYTYGLYMLHVIVLTALDKAFVLLRLDPAALPWRWLWPPLGLVLSIAVAKASFLYFESPFLRLKERFSRMSPARPLEAAQSERNVPIGGKETQENS